MVDILAIAIIDDILYYLYYAAIIAGISYAINALTAKVPKMDIPPPDAFNQPEVREGVVYPIIFGTCYVENPCIAWFGDIEVINLVDHKSVNTGFNNKRVYYKVGTTYYAGVHFILCQGVTDGVKQIKNGDVVIWPIALDITTVNVDGATSISIDEPMIFGGRYDGGGVTGDISFMYGGTSQTQNSYLVTQLGSDVSAYRGVTSAVLEKVNVGNSPYLQNWKFLVKRTDVLTDGSAQWYISKAVINSYDINPAHILRECYTNTIWGFGIPSSLLPDSIWQVVADDLYDEGFGLSLKWEDANQSLYSFVKAVLKHIDAVIYQDPTTGYIVLKLLRDDYVIDDLDEYDESDIVSLTDFTRSSVYEGVNSLELTFWDRLYNKPIVVPDHDIAAINMQNNKLVFNKVEYYGIVNKTLAGKVLARERLQIGSFPVIFTLKAKRTMNELRPGDVFEFSYEPLGIEDMIIRVAEISFGTLTDGMITIKCIQDIFSLQTALYAEVPDTVWDYPDVTPVVSPNIQLMETPYYLLKLFSVSDEYFDTIKNGTDGFTIVMAEFAPNSSEFDLLFRPDSGDSLEDRGAQHYTRSLILGENISVQAGQQTVDVDIASLFYYGAATNPWWTGGGNITFFEGTYAVLGTEIVLLMSFDRSAMTAVIKRGCLDTVPQSHSDGDYIMLVEHSTCFVEDVIPDGDVPGAKVLPITPFGVLDDTSVTNAPTFDSRVLRPYPPDDILINSVSFASTFSGQPTISWYHRDRENISDKQYCGYHGISSAEAGTTYTLKIYDETGTGLLRTISGITGTSYTYSYDDEIADSGLQSGDDLNSSLRFVLYSVRGGYDSFQSYDITVNRV